MRKENTKENDKIVKQTELLTNFIRDIRFNFTDNLVNDT